VGGDRATNTALYNKQQAAFAPKVRTGQVQSLAHRNK
jgi:hypothetical protein